MDPVALALVVVNVLIVSAFGAILFVLHRSQEAERAAQSKERDEIRAQTLTLVEAFAVERKVLLDGFASERRQLLDRAIDTWEIVVARANDPQVKTVIPTGIASDEPQGIDPEDDRAYWDQREGG